MDSAFSNIRIEFETDAQSTFDLEEMVNQVWHSLHEEVDLPVIHRTLIEVLSDYKDARIQTFIPILACRETREILQINAQAHQIKSRYVLDHEEERSLLSGRSPETRV